MTVIKTEIFKNYFKSTEDIKKWLYSQSKLMKTQEHQCFYSQLLKLLEIVINKWSVVSQLRIKALESQIQNMNVVIRALQNEYDK